MAAPISAGLSTTTAPASRNAATLAEAGPEPPLMMAPAWPMRLPGGAVIPATKQTRGLLKLSAIQAAASSSALPPGFSYCDVGVAGGLSTLQFFATPESKPRSDVLVYGSDAGGPKAPGRLQTDSQKRPNSTPKDIPKRVLNPTPTCLSKGTGSAFQFSKRYKQM